MNKWDQIYRDESYDFRPNTRLAAWAPSLPVPPGGRALDLACGGGRNAVLLASLGWTVDAWDRSAPGLALLTAEAKRRGLHQRLQVRQVDLEAPGFTLPGAHWDLVISLYFLHRPLLAQVPRAVRPGGWVFVETVLDAGPGRRRSRNPAHKLQAGELRQVFAGWETALDREWPEKGIATLVARRPVA